MTELSLNIKMKELLGFPDFYGMNWDAMIDCLSYMRQPSAGMSSVALNDILLYLLMLLGQSTREK